MSEWRAIDGYEGRYEVSDQGAVRSLPKTSPHNTVGSQVIKGQMLAPWQNGRGYLCVALRSDGKRRKTFFVHRLVAAAFVPNPLGLPCVNHLDHNRANPQAENLEWCTQAQNLAHARRAGRMPQDYRWHGRSTPIASLTPDQVRLVRAAYSAGGISQQKLGDKFGVSKRTIWRVLSGEAYAHVQ
jgi:hypothetical protein